MRTLLLFLAYYLIVTPVGLVARIVKDPMARRRRTHSKTYWIPSPIS